MSPTVITANQMQIDFSARTHARAFDPETSHEAAESVREFAAGHCALILQSLIDHGPMTPEQIGVRISMDAYAVRKRLPELERAGLAAPTGETAPTVSGRSQRVWKAR